jgi:hypothetical protein
MYPQLTAAQQSRVVEEVAAFNAKFNRKRVEAESTALAAADQSA